MPLYWIRNSFAVIPMNDVGLIMVRFGSLYNVSFRFFFKKAKNVRSVANDRHSVKLDMIKALIPHAGCHLFQFILPILVLQSNPDTWRFHMALIQRLHPTRACITMT